jgi:hypothetical protein
MIFETPEEDLENAIAFALSQFPYKPPRGSSEKERQYYYRMVAKAVRERIALSWTYAPKPPSER